MNEPKININLMPGAQMNGYVKEQHNYFGNVQKITSSEVKENPVVDAEVVTTDKPIPQDAQERNGKPTFFIHPSVDADQEWQIHDEIVRLVSRQGIQEICKYLTQLSDDKKVLLPQNAEKAYNELVRLGMPDSDGYSLKTFTKYYKR